MHKQSWLPALELVPSLETWEVLGISGLQRRAFIVTVPKVQSYVSAERATGRSYRFLEGIEPRARNLGSALEKFDYDVTLHFPDSDPELKKAFAQIQYHIDHVWGPCLVHLLGHGDTVSGYLHLMPPSGITTSYTNLQTLVANCQLAAVPDNHQPRVLILDLCSATSAINGLLQAQHDDVWIAAAAGPDQSTYNGFFTTAVANALHRAADDPQEASGEGEFIGMNQLATDIDRELEELRSQTLTPPTNPRFLGRWTSQGNNDQLFLRRPRQVTVTPSFSMIDDRPASPQLQSFIDIRYFRGRAGQHFTGRRSILRELGTWAHASLNHSPLHVISGGPGSGKSSIISALTLAWHPQIGHSGDHADDSRRLLRRLPEECQQLPRGPVAAIDASQKRTSDLIPVLANQLANQTESVAPTSDNPGDFLDWIHSLPQPPLIIIDSIDQAVNSEGMAKILLRPLVGTRPDGLLVSRLLLGTRDIAALQGNHLGRFSVVHNLDEVDADELFTDLRQYFAERLPSTSPTTVDVPGTLADELSQRVGPFDCGAFLTATLYASHLEHRGIPSDERQLRQQMPRTLVQLFELQLRTGDDAQQAEERRKILSALAHAKGDGMPAIVANHLAHTIYRAAENEALPAILRHDDDIKLYLRYNIDSDGKPLYSLFHQSLAEHLRHDEPDRATTLTQALLELVTNWADAPPYLKRHLADHAAEDNQIGYLITQPNYLPHAHPHRLLPLLREPVPADGAMVASAYRSGAAYFRKETSATRRSPRVALDHIRAGLKSRLVTKQSFTWWPRWAKGPGLHPALLDTYLMLGDSVVTLKTLRRDGRTVILALTDHGDINIWDWRSGSRLKKITLDIPTPVTNAHILDHPQQAVVTIATAAQTLHIASLSRNGDVKLETLATDLHSRALTTLNHREQLLTAVAAETGIQLWEPSTKTRARRQPLGLSDQRTMTALTHTRHDGRNYLLATDTEGDTWKWDLDYPATAISPRRHHVSRPLALVSHHQGSHHLTATGSSDGVVRVWETHRRNPFVPDLTGPSSAITAVAVNDSPGSPLLAAADDDGLIWLWELRENEHLREIYYGHNGRINDLEFTSVKNRQVLNSGSSDGTVRSWDLTSVAPKPIDPPLSSKVLDVACGFVQDQSLVAIATESGSIYLRSLIDGAPMRPFHLSGLDSVGTMSVANVDGESVLLTAGYDRTLRWWDLRQLTDPRNEPVHVQPAYSADDHHAGVGFSDVTLLDEVSVACTVSENGETLLWDVRQRRRFRDHLRRHIDTATAPLRAITLFSWDNQLLLATGDASGYCRVWTFVSSGFRQKWGQRLPEGITSMTASVIEGEPIIACGGEDKTVRLWNPVDDWEESMEGHDGHITQVAAGAWGDRPVFASGDDEGQVRVWDGLTGQRYDTIRLPLSVSSLAFGPENELVIGAGREVITIDLRSDKE